MVKAFKLSFLGILFCLPFCGAAVNPLLFWSAFAAVILLFSCYMIVASFSGFVAGRDWNAILPAALICCLPAVFAVISGKGVIGAPEVSWVIYLLLFVLACFTITETEDLTLLAVTLSLSALAAALIGAYQYLFGFGSWSNTALIAEAAGANSIVRGELIKNISEMRVFSAFINSNVYAGYVAMILPPSLALCFAAEGKKSKILGIVSVAAAAVMLVLTRSFGGALSSAAGISVFLLIRAGLNKKTIIFTAALAAALVLFCYLLKPELVDISNPNNPFFGRLRYWRDALKIFGNAGLHGGGAGIFKRFSVSGVLYPHNMYLQFLLEYGVFGLSMLLLFLFPLLKAPAAAAAIKEGKNRTLLAGLLGACAAFLIHGFMDIDSNYLQNTSIFFVCAGAIAAAGLYKTGRLSYSFPSARGYPAIIIGLALIASIVLGKEHAINLAVSAVLLTIGTAICFIEKREFPAGKTVYAALWFSVILVFSLFASKNTGKSLAELSRFACLACAFILGWSMRGSAVFGERAAGFAARLGIILSLVFIFLQFSGGAEGAEIFFPNRNLLGGFLVACATLCLPYVYSGGSIFNLKNAAVLLCSLGAVLTGSRGALMSLAAVFTLFMIQSAVLVAKDLLSERIRFFTTLSILVFAAAALVLPGGLADRFAEKGNSDPLAFERAGIYKSALSMVREKPLTGFGIGCFGGAYWQHKFPVNVAISRYERNTDFAHNEYLQLFSETGVPGGLLLLCLVFLVLLSAWKAFGASRGRGTLFLSGSAMALSAVFVHALVDFNLHFMPLLILTGALAGFSCGAHENKPLALGGKLPFLMSAFLILAAIIPVFSALAELSQRESKKAESYAKEGFIKAARVLDPLSAEYADAYAAFLLGKGGLKDPTVRILAEQEFKSACALDRFDPYYPRHLGRLYAANFMKEEALAAFSEACARSPFDPLIMSDFADVKYAMNDRAGCAALLERSILIEPKYAAGCRKLSLLYSIMGKEKGAKVLKERAIQTQKSLLPYVNTDYERALLEFK